MHEMGAVVVSRLRLCSPGAAPDTRWRGLYVGDALSMHLGVQDVTVHDGEDSEDGKGGGSGMEGGRLGSRGWQLLGVVPSSWGLPGWSWRQWECPGTCACSTNGPCMHHAQTMGGIKPPRLM